MPLPEPTSSESRQEFIDRCMVDDESLKDFPDRAQRFAVCSSQYRKDKLDEKNNSTVSKTVEKGLQNKLDDHKEKVGKDKRKQTTLRKLKIVYNRGIGAYRSNPSSVRPSVSSPEQWAQARVNSFLHALRNLRYRSGKHDTDLLPKEHPMSGDDKKKASEKNTYNNGEKVEYEVIIKKGENKYGEGNKFYLDGELSPNLVMIKSNEYKFNISDASNKTHALRFSITEDGVHKDGKPYNKGVSINGKAGEKEAFINIKIDEDTPNLYYYCVNHPGMGGKIEVTDAKALSRKYADGEPIPSALPEKYRKARKTGETKGQACINCTFYKEDHEDYRFYCTHWKAPIRPQYWCASWKPMQENLDINPDKPMLKDSKWDRFDFDFALRIKEKYPRIWKAGGNIRGNGAFRNWKAYREGSRTDAILSWVREREAWTARHFEDGKQFKDKSKSANISNIAGIVAQIKWGSVGTIGEARMKEVIREVIDKLTASRMGDKKFAFSSFEIKESQVDSATGEMLGVSLISVGEASGHGLYVDDDSLQGIVELLEEQKLPAYITHSGALFEDRLTREVGMFSNFRIEEDRLIADFQAFDSFMEDDSRTFNRLFEMAEKMPEKFGLSIVFSAASVWATPDGDVDTLEKPDNALFDFPSIRAEEVTSADFVDTPAANERGLFSKIDKPIKSKMTKLQLSELVESLELQKRELEEQVATQTDALEEHEDKDEAMNALALEKAALEAEVEGLKVELEEANSKVAELEAKLDNHYDEEKEMKAKMEEHEEDEEKLKKDSEEALAAKDAEILALKSLIAGSKPVATLSEGEDYEPSKSSRAKIISDYAKEHNMNEFSATLRLGKSRPEIFNL